MEWKECTMEAALAFGLGRIQATTNPWPMKDVLPPNIDVDVVWFRDGTAKEII